MWSFFSSDPAKSFPFEIGEKVQGLDNVSIWTLHEGKRKSNGEPVSVFAFDIKGSSDSQVQLAKASFKKIKTLRHPNILTFIDGLENDKVLYVVTEAVVPLETHLQQADLARQGRDLAIAWGLHQITRGLSFLVNDCNLIHNNVCVSAVFVNAAGEWKLGGVDYMYPTQGAEALPPVKILPELEKYDPPERAGPGRRPTEKWSTDSWGLGCLVWEVFNGRLPRPNSLKALGKIPKTLVPHYCELVGANPRVRPNPSHFVEKCCSKGGFMNNQFVKTMLFLEEIQIKDASEKNQFFNGLPPVLDTFPETFSKHRILPQLLHAFEYGNAGSAVLAPLFKLGKLLEQDEYQQKIVPCIIKLFSSTDRATRVKLLQSLDLFAEHLNVGIVNDQIFPNLCHGFSDTNPIVRESTIKSMLHLAPKLNYKNLNEELLKHFARLQSRDDQGGIRTNTTVCLGKVACHLNPQVRQKVLSSAYLRALKDPFPPARQAGILAMTATHNFFTLQESAQRLLPALCGMSLDPEKTVRDHVFRAIKCFVEKLEKFSENPELQEELEKDVRTGSAAASSAAGWAGWAVGGVSSLTSKLYKGKPRAPAQKTATHKEEKPAPETPAPAKNTTENTSRVSSEAPEKTSETSEPEEEAAGDNWDESWDDGGDDWGDMNESEEVTATAEEDTQGGWDDDGDWGSIEDSPVADTVPASSLGALKLGGAKKESSPSPWGETDFTTDTSVPSASSYHWDQPQVNKDDFFNSVIADSSSSKQKSSRNSPFSSAASAQDKSKNTIQSASKPRVQTNQSQQGTQLSSQKTSAATSKKTMHQSASEKKTMKQPASDWDSWGDESGWGSGGSSQQKQQQPQQQQQQESGWGDDDGGWGGDDWGTLDSGVSKAEEAKRQREQKRLERQRQIEEKRAARQAGGMKLGTKKLAKD